MTREYPLRIITANDLFSGEVVYLSQSGAWSPDYRAAAMLDVTQADHDLAEVQKRDTSVVGSYLANANRDAGNSPLPIHFREVFRAKGPTNRFLGKQARVDLNPHAPEHENV